MSMNFIVAGIRLADFSSSASLSMRTSGTGTMPVLGSMVQKGKFSAAALPLANALKRVDLPTLGSPTKPHESAMVYVKYWGSISYRHPHRRG